MKYQYRHSYRITKYFSYNHEGFLADDGWSSFSDVPEKVSLSDRHKKSGYRNRQKVKLMDLPLFLAGLLRENYWCKLTHFKCEFHFGYDYYLYCISQADLFDF